MPELIIDVPEDLFDRMTNFVSEDLLPGLAKAALAEWTGWLDGAWRPMSISEIEAERIFELYASVLIGQIPSPDHIGEFFDLPLGRSRYIMQVLNYRHGAFIRERQIVHIVQSLQMAESSLDGETITVRIDRSVRGMLDQRISDLVADERLRSVVIGRIAYDHVRYVMGSRHRDTLLVSFTEDLDAIVDREG